jgi:cytosine/adenosine deaminase-related metal-dependent hydrolase
MNRNPLVGWVNFVLLLSAVAVADEAYVNGHWYDGSGFVERTAYVSDGRISFKLPEQIDNTHDLAGAYVIPPFGEAHNHDLTTDFEPRECISEYLRDGVFYTKMQSDFSNGFERMLVSGSWWAPICRIGTHR